VSASAARSDPASCVRSEVANGELFEGAVTSETRGAARRQWERRRDNGE
jgi:hypothetical protein